MTAATQNILQEVFVLATGRSASASDLAWLESIYNRRGDFSQIASEVNAFMGARASASGSVSATVKAVALDGLGNAYSDAEATAVTNSLLGRGIDSWAKLFEFCINLTDSGGMALDNRAAAGIDFNSTLDSLSKASLYSGDSVNAAVKNLMQNIGSSASSLNNGKAGLAELAGRLTTGGIQSKVVDGYVAGATVFVDTNGDGVLSPGEFSTTTDASGNFVLPAGTAPGNLVARGGTDLLTGKAFQGTLTASAGSTVINPLTTMVQSLVAGGQSGSVEQATATVMQALNLPSTVNLLTYDPVAVLANANASTQDKATALSVQSVALQIANIITQTTVAIDSAKAATPGSAPAPSSASAVTAALAGALATAAASGGGTGTLNLSSSATLSSIVSSAATTAGANTVVAQADKVALVTAASNTTAAAATSLTDLSKAAVISQGSATTALASGGSSGSFDTAVTGFTGSNLNTAVNSATPGQIIPGVSVTPPPPPASGGGGAPATFSVTEDATTHVVTFGGTVSGNVTLSVAAGGLATFTRAGLTATLPNYATATGGLDLSGLGSETLSVTSTNTSVKVAGAASVAKINALSASISGTGTLTYTALSDSAANLLPSGVASSAIKSGTNVTVTGPVSLANLALIDTANGAGTLSYTALSDTANNLAPSGVAAAAILSGTNVTVTTTATVAQINAIDTANGAGTLSYTALTDTAGNLAPAGTASGVIKAATDVTVSDGATVAQITAIDAANTTGALTYTALADTASNLAPSGVAVGAIKAGTNVTVTGAATVAQISAIDVANTTGSLNYTALSDSANNLAPSGVAVGAIKAATDVTVTSAATVAQISAIDSANTTGALTYTALSDSAANLLPSGVASSAIKSGTNVTVTGTLSVAQHGLIDAANGSGTLSYTDLSDTAANLLPSGIAAAAITAGVNVSVTSALSVSGLTLIDNANGGGTLSYSALTDSADNLAPSGTVIGAVKSGTTVTLTGTSASAVQLTNLDTATTAAVGAASLTSITGTATEIVAVASAIAAGTITHGGNWNSTPTGTATVAQINTINANNGTGTITATVSDTSAATLATLTGTHALTTTVAAGSAAAADLNAIDTATSVTVGATAVTTLTGTAANVKTAIASAGISLSGSYAVTVSDSTSVADANTIDAATTGVVTASITEGAVSTLKTLTGTNNAYTITITDTTAAAADLKALDAATTVNVGASAVTTITGTATDIKTVAAAGTISRNSNWAATVSGSVSVADANTIEAANGSGVVTATISEGAVSTLKTLTGTGNAYTLNVSDATVTAADLKALDALTTVNVGASSVTTINGTAADVRDVAVAATIARAANWASGVTGSLSVSDANAIDGANGTGVITASISDGTLSTLKTLTGTNNAYTITVSDATGAAADLKAVDAASTATVTATAVTTITGTAADVKDVAAAAGISKAANWAATVSGSVSVADANTIDAANGTGIITATIAEGAVSTLKTLTGTGNAYTLNLSDTTATAADLKTLDGLTTVNVGASSVTTITGSAADVKDVAAASTITRNSNWAATLSGTVSVADANTIDAANGTGVITATIASGTAASLRSLTGTGNAYALTTTDTSVAAADLIALDTRSTVNVAATAASTLTGSAGDVATAISATTINTAGDVAVTVSGTATVAQMATIKANTTGSITYSLEDTAANIATAVAGNATVFTTATAISHTAVQVGAATGTTGVVDTFKFASAGNATISNFIDGSDKLDLTAFVNSTIAFQALAADANTVDIAVSDSGADRLLQVDTNNDGAADFSITLTGRAGATIDSADFNQTGSPTAPTSVTITPVGGTVVTNAINGTNTNLSLSATIVAGEATGGKAEFYVGATKLGEDTSIAAGDTSVSYTTAGSSHDELHAVLAAGGVVSVKLFTSDGHNATSSAGNPTLLVDYDAATAPTSVQVNAVGGTVVANTINSTNTHLTAQATIVAGEATGGSATLKVNGTTVATDSSIGAGDTQVTFTTSDGTPTNAELLAAIATGGTVTVTLTDAAGNAVTSSVGNPTLTRDVTAPGASGSTPIAGSDMAGASGYGEGDVITLKFSEAVDTSKVTLGNLSLSAHSLGTSPTLTAVDASGGYASTFRIVLGASATVAATDTITLAASNAVDAAGNPAAADVTFTVPAITAPVLTRATTGTDTLVGTAANDVFVIVGVTAAGQYSGSDANFADLTTLNSKSASEANSGDSINGGAGYNVLHVYGTTDLSGVTLSNIQKVVMHSDVTFTEAQLGIAGLAGISGYGGSSMRIVDSGAASVDLSALALNNIGQLDLGDNVKAIASQTNLGALTSISSGVTDRLTPLPTGAGVTGVTTVSDLVAKMTAAPGYANTPFTVSESGGNLVLTWKTNGNITGTSFLQKSASGGPIYATVTDGTAGTQEVHTIAPGTLTAGDVYRLSAGDSTSALQGSTGVSLDLAGKSVFGNMPVLEADSSVKYAALDTAGVGTPVNTVISSINALLVAIDSNSGSFITTALGGAAAKNTLVAPVVEGEYKLVFGFLDTTANVLKGREGFQNFIAGGAGSDYLYGASDKSNFITAGANETLNTPTNRLFGGGQRDFLAGGDGKDIIWGGGGSDFVASGKGDDTLYGEDGTDLLDGGEGNDLIVGGAGVDFLQGGAGNDKIAFTTTATQDYLLDFSGAGTALASFSASDELLIFDLTVFTGLTGVAGAASIEAPKALASNVVYVGTSAAFGALGAGTAAYRLWLNTDGYAGGGASTLIYDADGNWQAGNVNVVSLLGVNTLGAGDIGVY